ncbi:MAG TPA: SRPBCC family protein [Solirubrobacteraceae bacterium]|nr:SRPBCC family protein [Solirubrobacteraceae bacterium]
MPTTRRSRVLAAGPDAIWDAIADPHHLPRWWPRVERVENVGADSWTTVMRSPKGRAVRADFRLLETRCPSLRRFEQVLEDTPFARLMTEAVTEITLDGQLDRGTEVTIETAQRLRGMARFGVVMFRRATRRTLDEALDGLEHACGT